MIDRYTQCKLLFEDEKDFLKYQFDSGQIDMDKYLLKLRDWTSRQFDTLSKILKEDYHFDINNMIQLNIDHVINIAASH